MLIRIFFALVTLVILGLAIASSVYILEKVEKPKVEAVREIKDTAPPKPIDPGLGEFDAAIALIKSGDLLAARDKLRHIIRFFPKSERYAAARSLCSEINLDLVVDPAIAGSKTTYKVERGDSVSLIAKRNDCTLEYIKCVNGLMDFKIQPGDQLVVRPLEFTVLVKTQAKKLILLEGEEFFAEFALSEVKLPSGLSVPFEDRIRSKAAWFGQSSVGVTERGYDEAAKQLRLGRRSLIISAPPDDGTEGSTPDSGIFMDPADIAELNMLLRVGTPVQVVL